jgi:UrcA family protein
MKIENPSCIARHQTIPVLVALGVVLGAGAALAQATSSETVTVPAARVAVYDAGRTSSGLAVVRIFDRQHVEYRDLDPSKPADAATLRKRIEQAAKNACAELDRDYAPPQYLAEPPKQHCVENAIDEATRQIPWSVAVAGK